MWHSSKTLRNICFQFPISLSFVPQEGTCLEHVAAKRVIAPLSGAALDDGPPASCATINWSLAGGYA